MSETATTSGETWTTRRLLAWLSEAFAKAQLDSPRLSAELLLAHVLGVKRLALFTDADRQAGPGELATLRGLASRALRHEPIQYLVGQWPFFGLTLRVDSRGLIPRPCTETMVELAIAEARARGSGAGLASSGTDAAGETHAGDRSSGADGSGGVDGPGAGTGPGAAPDAGSEEQIDARAYRAAQAAERARLAKLRGQRAGLGAGLTLVDLCTGSGCVALALAKNLPAARVVATDISADALALAGENAGALGLQERVELRRGDLFAALPAELRGRVDVLTANPPYIPDGEWAAVEANVKEFEPELALRGGSDGLSVVGPVIRGAKGWLKPGGLLIVEIASSTAAAVLALAREGGRGGGGAAGGPGGAGGAWREARIVKDLEGHERFLVARA